jgi:hypothetical protein
MHWDLPQSRCKLIDKVQSPVTASFGLILKRYFVLQTLFAVSLKVIGSCEIIMGVNLGFCPALGKCRYPVYIPVKGV